MVPRSVIPKRPLLWMAAVIVIAVTALTIPKTFAASPARKSGETKVTRNAQRTPSVEFTADFVQPGGSTVQRYYQKGDKTRQENPSGWMVRVVDKAKGSARVLFVRRSTKTYIDVTTKAPDHMLDQGAWIARNWKRVGVEKLNGYDCIKYVSPDANSTFWFSAKLGLVVKEVDKGPTPRVLQYRNIRERQVPDSVFEVPAGYRREIPKN